MNFLSDYEIIMIYLSFLLSNLNDKNIGRIFYFFVSVVFGPYRIKSIEIEICCVCDIIVCSIVHECSYDFEKGKLGR